MLTFKQRYKPRTTREYTKSDLTVYDSAGNTALNALSVYGKSEVVDGVIKSAGEGYAVVDLGTLTWTYQSTLPAFSTTISDMKNITIDAERIFGLYCSKYVLSNTPYAFAMPDKSMLRAQGRLLYIKNLDYTDPAQFKTAMNDVLLCYELADPTQGNAIAVKTDNGSGVSGTMATFTTGTPLYGISDTVRDAMNWDGSAGTVTKVCGEIDLGTLDWLYNPRTATPIFQVPLSTINCKANSTNMLSPIYTTQSAFWNSPNNDMKIASGRENLYISNFAYTNATDFKTAMSGVKLIYELETPTVTPLTQAENESLASLRAFKTTTHFTNNANTDMTVNYTMRVPTIN